MTTVRDLLIKLRKLKRHSARDNMLVEVADITFILRPVVMHGIVRLRVSATARNDKTTPAKTFTTTHSESDVIVYMTTVANNIGRPKARVTQSAVTTALLSE